MWIVKILFRYLQEEELHGEKAQLEAAKAAYKGARCREQESNGLARQQGERARRAEQLAEQLRAELDTQRWVRTW